jgi:20S proteasome alpha/beta subunit
LEVRDTDQDILDTLADAFRRAISAIARRRKLMFEFEILSEIKPVKCDPGIVETITGVVKDGRVLLEYAKRRRARHAIYGQYYPGWNVVCTQ